MAWICTHPALLTRERTHQAQLAPTAVRGLGAQPFTAAGDSELGLRVRTARRGHVGRGDVGLAASQHATRHESELVLVASEAVSPEHVVPSLEALLGAWSEKHG